MTRGRGEAALKRKPGANRRAYYWSDSRYHDIPHNQEREKAMINIIPSEKRYHADHGWLDTRWHFSFSDYYDESNMNWSALRVFNDDIVKGGGGFDFHPHRDMEIVSYIVDGALEHRDRLGNRHVNRAGEVQVMSAGTGIVHAESNPSPSEPMRLLQFWILPRHKNLPPRWEQQAYTRE